MGWLANVFLIIGSWLLGYKWRHAFLFVAVGEAIWIVSCVKDDRGWDMIFLCAVFCILALRNWYKWTDFKIFGHYHVIPRTWWQRLFRISPFGKIKITGSYQSGSPYQAVTGFPLKETHPWVQEPDQDYKDREAMTLSGPRKVYLDLETKGKIVRMTWERHKFELGYKRMGWIVTHTFEGRGEGEGGYDTIWEKPNGSS